MSDLVQKYDSLPEEARALVRPALRLRTTRVSLDELPLGASRIGGCPDLPPSFKWPEYKKLEQAFIAQINLDEVSKFRPVLPLPSTGNLYFFYGTQQEWGYEPEHKGSAAVVYSDAAREKLSRVPIPDEVDEASRLAPCSLKMEFAPSLPHVFGPWYIDGFPEFDAKTAKAWKEFGADYTASIDGPEHYLGGYPSDELELQAHSATTSLYYKDDKPPRTMKEEVAEQELSDKRAREWKLLLQVDSDDTANVMWGDMGKIYYFVRAQDLAAHDYSNPWLVLDCH